MKKCNYCGTEYQPKRKDGKFCSPRCQTANWRKENPERAKEIKRKSQAKFKKNNPDRVKELMNNWYKSKGVEYHRNYYNENPGYGAAKTAKYRSTKLNATPQWLNELDLFLIEEIYECSQLRSELTGIEHHVDHIVPLQGELVCGLHVPWNLRVITAKENLAKGNRYGIEAESK